MPFQTLFIFINRSAAHRHHYTCNQWMKQHCSLAIKARERKTTEEDHRNERVGEEKINGLFVPLFLLKETEEVKKKNNEGEESRTEREGEAKPKHKKNSETGGEEKINRLSFLCFFSRKQRRLKKKKQRTEGGRLYRGESKLWPAIAPSSSSSFKPVLAATPEAKKRK